MAETSTVSRRLAAWASGLTYDQIPADVVEVAKLRMLDAIGVRLAATRSELGAAASRVGSRWFPGESASATTGGPLTPARAFLDATLTACLDFDDTHDATLIHPSSTIVPAVSTMARCQSITGSEFITALVVGYEVCCRVGMIAPGEFHKRGFHPTGVLGSLGAAAAVARGLRCNPVTFEHSLGLAASMSGGLLQAMIDGTDARYANSGIAATNGIMAAVLASEGFTGAGAPIDGRFGLIHAHLQGECELSMSRATEGLGETWEVLGIATKPYPTGYVTHAFIDAVLDMVSVHGLRAQEIAAFECKLSDAAAQLVFQPIENKIAPRSAAAARVALPHILAEAAVYGEIGADSFGRARLDNPDVRALASKAAFRTSSDGAANALTVTMSDGRVFARQASRRSMTDADIVEKFIINAAPVSGVESARIFADRVVSSATPDLLAQHVIAFG
jgi:2-methylcitrate dehydratase PrpD